MFCLCFCILLQLIHFFCSLEANNSITVAGAKALGSMCSDSITVSFGDGSLDRVFADDRAKAGLIRQFGATPLKRFRLYVCGFGGELLGACKGVMEICFFSLRSLVVPPRGGKDNPCRVTGARLADVIVEVLGRQ
jgi:hypothetical protein